MAETIDDTSEFTDEELRAALKLVGSEAKRKAFAAGRPVLILKGRRIVAVYPDGKEVTIEPIGQNARS
jgi:hypothetical protein